LIIGKEEIIECVIDELKKNEFNLKVERNVNEYFSCCIEESKDEGKLTMIQLHLLTCLIKNFACGIKIGLFFSKKNPGHIQVFKSHNKEFFHLWSYFLNKVVARQIINAG
jgi:hypothetical protein